MYPESDHLKRHGGGNSNGSRFEKGLCEYSREAHMDGVDFTSGLVLSEIEIVVLSLYCYLI